MPNRDALESQWRANQAELKWIYGSPPLDCEMMAKRSDDLEAEQNRIEFELGRDHSAAPGLTRSSDTP
jgi:hypothetical protein